MVPGDAGGEVLLDVGGERTPNLIVGVDVVNVSFVSVGGQLSGSPNICSEPYFSLYSFNILLP